MYWQSYYLAGTGKGQMALFKIENTIDGNKLVQRGCTVLYTDICNGIARVRVAFLE